MEEQVGQFWHRLITRAARADYPQAAVTLGEMERSVGVLFRALGGDGGLRVENATAVEHGARRSWLARVAGAQQRVELGWRDRETLRLPARLALFPKRSLNRDLYLWLAALAAVGEAGGDWFAANQAQSRAVLERWPGLAKRYQRLAAAHLAQRPDPARLPAAEAAAERAIRQALVEPARVATLPPAPRPPQPVPLWLNPAPPRPLDKRLAPAADMESEPEPEARTSQELEGGRRQAERVDEPDGRRGLLVFRLESLFSWSEYVKVDRPTEEDEDIDAAKVADDLEVISVSQGGKSLRSRLRFDLDLPAAEHDDTPLGEGLPFPEWDWRKGVLRPDYCRVQPMVAREAAPCALPVHLRRPAARLRRQFQALAPVRTWRRGQPDGSDVDLDAWLAQAADRRRGQGGGEQNLYREFRGGHRDLACLLLADLSLSTDTWVNDQDRVIDVIRDSLFLFAEALSATADRFALYGFSSRRRSHVRVHTLKTFEEDYTDPARGRIQAMRPGYYTRMGAAVRYATDILARQRAGQRLLILLTDGKPNDLDCYEGRYGVEDTRVSLIEARRAGLLPFCVTIDQQARAYLPYLFGNGGYVVIRNPLELPRRLPLLYARLSR